MEFMIGQLWWLGLIVLMFSLINLSVLVLIASVVVKIYERSEQLGEITEIKREIKEIRLVLPTKRRLESLMEITTPQSPYEVGN